MRIHGSCVARDGSAVLLLGPPGAGKSDLALRLMDRGFDLVADDQVLLDGLAVRAPEALRGLLEVRGLGIFQALPVADDASLALVVDLVAPADVVRLPLPAAWPPAGVPRIALHGFEASACDKLAWALDAATGRRAQRAGAFAA
ncbi:HPr kinase/phosphorylase [Roseomonas fluvialis]|uniref:HPr kinase n=1 Tax=Roseomonas fluvialis TaxID=1750527 RepID=A0ABM7XXA2_9PROT|nr:HPr kinase/phosphatase C-terminal domain-containing protein [Roseomonas fluvialis]BDG70092.1 HPr kinase [Roseomonas fluvialis]